MATPNHRIRIVASFEELISTPFEGDVNALCWQRECEGDFDEIVRAIGPITEITTLDAEDLESLSLSPAGQKARAILIQDQALLRDANLAPILDCIPEYPVDPKAGPIRTDVYSFHADSATALADTYLCSYNVAGSQGLNNEEAVKQIDILETRKALLESYHGADDQGFTAYLKENFYDLHYAALPHARPYTFGLQNLWRIATDWPGSPVLPCIHRAPATKPNQPPRLLLIS